MPVNVQERIRPGLFRTPGDIVRAIEEKRYDILHAHHNPQHKIALKVYRHVKTSRRVHTQHGYKHFSRKNRARNTISLLFSHGVIFNSNATRASLSMIDRIAALLSKQAVIYNGLPVDDIDQYRRSFQQRDHELVVSVANLKPVKNHVCLLNAMAYLQDTPLRAEIVGDGPLSRNLQARCSSLGLEKTVKFSGMLRRENVYQAVSTAGMFVVLSFAEGFCVAAAEAMALGLPVIASNIPVFHEVIGDAGIYVDPRDPAAVAGEIRRLSREPREAQQRGDLNRQRAVRLFNFDVILDDHIRFYNSVVKRGGSG